MPFTTWAAAVQLPLKLMLSFKTRILLTCNNLRTDPRTRYYLSRVLTGLPLATNNLEILIKNRGIQKELAMLALIRIDKFELEEFSAEALPDAVSVDEINDSVVFRAINQLIFEINNFFFTVIIPRYDS